MIYLPDVNLWIALTAGQHIHHPKAKAWLDQIEADKIAFCRITELGLLRLLTNSRVMGGAAVTPQRAWQIYDEFREDPRILFLAELPGFSDFWRQAGNAIEGGANAWTDSYLAAFAAYERLTVVTFDRRFRTTGGASLLTL